MRALFLLALIGCKKSTAPTPMETPVTASAGVEVVKGPLDAREYKVVKLDNGLRALVIHDPDSDMAAASLEVHIGHYADPGDREGLAHFLEHMLFMGTDEFPEVDAYGKFIQNNGGWSNAGTGGESTGYFFQVEAKHLEGAFDRFGRFFVAPLLDPTYVDRERNAVNSEYSLKIKDHARRIREVRKSTMNQAHPESKFSVGNLDTLADRGEDTVHSALLKLYEGEYRPDRMTMAIIGNEPVSVLEAWVKRELSDVKGEPVAAAARPKPFTEEQLGVRIDMAPIAERRHLEIQWVAEDEQAFWPQRPHSYVLNMLGHEGEGTLFAELKEKGWIERLYAGGWDGADDFDLLVASYDLTEEGAKHIDTIVAATLDAVEKIEAEGLQDFRHTENATMAELNFKYAEESPVVRAVNAATSSLYWAPPEHVLDHWAVYGDFDAALIREKTLPHLNAEQMRLLVTLPEEESGATLDQTEERYQVKYGVRKFTDAEKAAYTGDSGVSFALPPQNKYLPENVALKGDAEPGIPAAVDADAVALWHLLDTSFGVPRANTVVEVFSPMPRASGAKSMATASLYGRLLNDAFQEFAYPLGQAGLSYRLDVHKDGMTLDVFGYDDRQGALLEDLAGKIRSLKVDPERFTVAKAALARDWRNSKSRRPINQAGWAMGETLDPHDFSTDEMLPLLEKVTLEQVQSMADSFFATASARLFVHGNLTVDQAKSLAGTVETTLLRDSKPLDSLARQQRLVPAGKQIVRNLTIDHDDSTLMVRYQDAADDLDSQARWRLLGQLVSTPFFTQLRTEQQLGYVVSGRYRGADKLPGVTMRIQSTVAGPVTLLERVDAFLKSQHDVLESMSEDEFVSIRKGLSARLRESKTQLRQKSGELRTNLALGHTTFDQRVVVADRVDMLNKAEMVELWEQVFLADDAGRLVLRSFGAKHQDEVDGKGCDDEACAAKELGELYSRELL